MLDFFQQTTFRAMLAGVFLMGAVYVAFHLISVLRHAIRTDDTNDRNLAEEFEEMRLSGDIEEEELRSIKAVLEKRG